MTSKSLAAIGLCSVFLLGFLVHASTVDLVWVQEANALDVGTFGQLTRSLYDAFEPPFAVLWAALAAAIAWRYTRSLRGGLLFGLTVACTWLPVVALKLIFHRPRPIDLSHGPALPPTDWSFSSGHVAFITALAMAFYLLTRKMWVAVAGALAVTAMTIAVLIDGMHYPTDALASIVWSVSLAPLMWQLVHSKRTAGS